MDTPVSIIIFNRPDKAKMCVDSVARAKPQKLFIIADGPRTSVEGETEICCKTRAIVEQSISWDCQVHKIYSEVNLGCGVRPATGITEVFKHVDRTIILEDDCLPDPSFFPYCDTLLKRYEDEPRVGMIAGTNLGVRSPSKSSYYFSKFVQIWGWATWKRAWNHFDLSTPEWKQIRKTNWLTQWLESDELARHYTDLFDRHFYRPDIWDYMWVYSMWRQQSYCIIPQKNLVSNIGFDKSATHTDFDYFFANAKTRPLSFPINHPNKILTDSKTEFKLLRAMNKRPNNLWVRIKRRLKKLTKS